MLQYLLFVILKKEQYKFIKEFFLYNIVMGPVSNKFFETLDRPLVKIYINRKKNLTTFCFENKLRTK